jgi:hypothetical protein
MTERHDGTGCGKSRIGDLSGYKAADGKQGLYRSAEALRHPKPDFLGKL